MAAGLVSYDVNSDSDVEAPEGCLKGIVYERPKATGNITTLDLPRIDPTPLVPAGVSDFLRKFTSKFIN